LYAAKLVINLTTYYSLARATLRSQLGYYISKFDIKYLFIFDCWTAINQQAFLGIIIHWIDKDWSMESKLLDMINLEEKHSGYYLFQCLWHSLEDFGIEEYIFG